MENDKEIEEIERETRSFNANMLPFGSMDVHVAIETAIIVGQDGDWVAEQVRDYMDDTDTKIDDIDIVCCIYDSIFQLCRNEISDYTQKDIINDLDEYVDVYGNYMCSCFEGTEKVVNETLKLAKKIPEEERSKQLKWFILQLENMY